MNPSRILSFLVLALSVACSTDHDDQAAALPSGGSAGASNHATGGFAGATTNGGATASDGTSSASNASTVTTSAPSNVTVAPGASSGSVTVYFSEITGSSTGGSITYTVSNDVDTVAGTGSSSPITVSGLSVGTGYRFTVTAHSAAGDAPSAATGRLYFYDVVETFNEPMCSPNNTIFTGSFTLDTTNLAVSYLKGRLTQAMTMGTGPMTTVDLKYQLDSKGKTLGSVDGLLVSTFALDTTDVFAGGGFTSCDTEYYGLTEKLANNHNAYATIFVSTRDPKGSLASDQLIWLAYADCTEGGMMGSTCMTGTSDNTASYGCLGTMNGYPASQVISAR